MVGYKSDLVRLFDAIDELIAAGLSRDDALHQLRRAVQDGRLLLLDLHDRPWSDSELRDGAVRLIEAFKQQRRWASHYDAVHFRDLVVMSRSNFEATFGLGAAAPEAKGEASPRTPADQTQPKKKRATPGQSRAKKALNALFPNGIPDEATKTNVELVGEVQTWLEKQRPQIKTVGRDTILRAAGRQPY